MDLRSKIPFFIKLTIVQILLVIVFCIVVINFGKQQIQKYNQEYVQRLYENLASYILDHSKQPLLNEQGEPNKKALSDIAMHTMMINPLVEVYLLDDQGKVLGHALPVERQVSDQINVSAIDLRLNSSSNTLVIGENPGSPGVNSTFSVAEINADSGTLMGYLYVVLSSSVAGQVNEGIQTSYVLKSTLFFVFALFLLVMITLWVYLFVVTLPIKRLALSVRQFFADELKETTEPDSVDEVKDLELAFYSMQERIKTQIKLIKQADLDRRDLISNISHDLRTPLASIQGYVESVLVKSKSLSEHDKKEYLEIALKNCIKLNKLIGQLFELSKLDSSGIKPKMEVFSLSELVSDVIQSYRLQSENKLIHLNVNIEDNFHTQGDIYLINRVFQNLLDNALKHTHQGGQVDVSVYRKMETVVVEVADDGVGMSHCHQQRIFESYYTGDNSVADDQPGTGLGLAIVKRILELHQSHIEVESAPQEGANFKFTLSLA